ncbi:hypothetical protein FQZ97_1062520 [compost metagenome]
MKLSFKNGHDTIADKLIHYPVLGNDLVDHYIKVVVQHFYYGIRFFIFADGGKAANVNKNYGGFDGLIIRK